MAVLLVVKPDGTRKLYRGTNMEVMCRPYCVQSVSRSTTIFTIFYIS